MTNSNFTRRGTFAYEHADAELGVLADAAKRAAVRAGVAIDQALALIAASEMRIAAMEAAGAQPPAKQPPDGCDHKVRGANQKTIEQLKSS